MTDWLSTGDDRDREDAAITSGVDLIMPGGKKTIKQLETGLTEKKLSPGALKKACARVLALIFLS